MIELPEAVTISKQLNESIYGKRIMNVIASHSPHKFAWYHGDPQKYHDLLAGKTIGMAEGFGSMVQIKADDTIILFGEGVGIRFHREDEKKPQKHQLLIEFEDFSALTASVQMYGGLWCFKEGDFENQYYFLAKEKPSPLSNEFDRTYFDSIISAPGNEKISTKRCLPRSKEYPVLETVFCRTYSIMPGFILKGK